VISINSGNSAMNSNSIHDCRLLDLPRIYNPAGSITAVNNLAEIPFSISRVYYLFDVPGGEARGGHAHKDLQQLILAASGSFDIIIDDGAEKRRIHLNRPYTGLYMPSGIWRELDNFSSGSICLVLASLTYSEDDYIRDYPTFRAWKSLK
jgi:hypothetical protein